MSLLITPLKGVGSIKFGMTPSEARKKIDGEYKSFKRTPTSELPCDYFELHGVFIYYKLPGVVEAIEFSDPSSPTLENEELLKMSFIKLKEFLYNRDPELEVEDDSLTSYKLGIGAYASNAVENPDSLIESVIAFEKGYYD